MGIYIKKTEKEKLLNKKNRKKTVRSKIHDLPHAEMDRLYTEEGLSPSLISRKLKISLALTEKYFYGGGEVEFQGKKRTKSESVKINCKRAYYKDF